MNKFFTVRKVSPAEIERRYATDFETARALTDGAIDRLTKRSNWLEAEIAKMREELRHTDETLGALVDARASWEIDPIEIEEELQSAQILRIVTDDDGTYKPSAEVSL